MWLDLGEYHGPSHFHAFVMFCTARTKQRGVIGSYREYVTESLRNIPQGKYMTKPWQELMKPHEEIDVEATIEHVISALEG